MLKEHLVHFRIIDGGETKQLRGLLFLEQNVEPSAEDYARCLRDCGHDVRLIDPKNFIYEAVKENGQTYLIDVLENYESQKRDLHTDYLARTFKRNDPIL
ncbi:hypothetical protein [Paenibacillus sp. NPDC058071]|uniref:hypothetical protein n=1 Tax=Paenibacillus sp. NPDC058071 TaxID=3346326 RepID=UPI0036D7BB2D